MVRLVGYVRVSTDREVDAGAGLDVRAGQFGRRAEPTAGPLRRVSFERLLWLPDCRSAAS